MAKQLNLPILDLLENSQSILIAGAGGGFDIYAGLPIYFTLRELGKNVHLANYSFSYLELTEIAGKVEKLIDGLLIAALGEVRYPLEYLPELYLSQWFKEVRNETVPIWMFDNTGVVPLTAAYEKLVEHLQIDAIILVDGGVDSLMRGDEEGAGSVLEDTISLLAVNNLDVPVKVLASIGFGTEFEEKVCHYLALENMAALIKLGAFHGCCALTPEMPAFQLYEAAARYTWGQPKHRKSHISTRIIPAVHGEFADFNMFDFSADGYQTNHFLSVLMGLYWFFDVPIVTANNQLARALIATESKDEAWTQTKRFLMSLDSLRRRKSIPY